MFGLFVIISYIVLFLFCLIIIYKCPQSRSIQQLHTLFYVTSVHDWLLSAFINLGRFNGSIGDGDSMTAV